MKSYGFGIANGEEGIITNIVFGTEDEATKYTVILNTHRYMARKDYRVIELFYKDEGE